MGWRNFFFSKAKSSTPSDTPEILHKYDRRHPEQGDLLILKRLEEVGADLSLPREVAHFMYLPNAEAARQVAAALRQDGYDVEEKLVGTATGPNQWAIVSRIDAIVNEQTVETARSRFEELSRLHGGEYDGWEATAKP